MPQQPLQGTERAICRTWVLSMACTGLLAQEAAAVTARGSDAGVRVKVGVLVGSLSAAPSMVGIRGASVDRAVASTAQGENLWALSHCTPSRAQGATGGQQGTSKGRTGSWAVEWSISL